MSSSKFTMAKKLCRVQQRLMSTEITDTSLEELLPLIFNECLRENMTFWFNFIENAVVLNLRDVQHENNELNIRQYYSTIPSDGGRKELKRDVLINAFLITTKSHSSKDNDASSADKKEEDLKQEQIPMTDAVPPTSIRTVIEMLEKEGKPVNRKTIGENLQLNKMSTDNRRRCIAYLKSLPEVK